MPKKLFSIIESPRHPNFSSLYKALGIEEQRFNTMRKVIKALKSAQPDFIVAEFFYGYGNNYAGVNLSNLDVMLYSLQKDSPDTKVIVFADKEERQYVDKLEAMFPLHGIFVHPIAAKQFQAYLK